LSVSLPVRYNYPLSKEDAVAGFGAWQKFLAASECDAQLVLEREFATREKRL